MTDISITASTTDQSIAEAPQAKGPSHTRRLALAKPALKATLAEIDSRPDFAPDPAQHEEARILSKLTAYRAWLLANDLRPPRQGQKPASSSVLAAIGHFGWKAEGDVLQAILGLADLIRPGDAFRHRPERAIDLTFDLFAERVMQRGYGLPRRRDDGAICWVASAEDAGCHVSDLDSTAVNCLRAIDAMVAVPGPFVDAAEPPLMKDAYPPPNPAARGLIDAAIAEMTGIMPADPLDPESVDLPTFADMAGIGVVDIVRSPSNAAAITAGAAASKLIPHPALKARRITYRMLKVAGRAARRLECKDRSRPANAARDTVGSLTKFIGEAEGGSPDDQVVPADFVDRVALAIAAHDGSLGSGWKADMERWVRYYDELRASLPLPEVFASALRVLIAEAGLTLADVEREFSMTARKWAMGVTFPSHNAEATYQSLCKRLRITSACLSPLLANEWRRHSVGRPAVRNSTISRTLPAQFAEMSEEEQDALIATRHAEFATQPTVHAAKLSQALRDEYRLAPSDWTPAMHEAFSTLVPQTAKPQSVLPMPGERRKPGDEEEELKPWSAPSIGRLEDLLGSTLGYFARPAGDRKDVRDLRPAPDAKPTKKFLAEPGLGIPRDLLHPAVFAFIDLITLYGLWNHRRNGGETSPIIGETVRHVMRLLKPGSGIIYKNPQYLSALERFHEWWMLNQPVLVNGGPLLDIEPFREDWEAAVAREYEQLGHNLRHYNRGYTAPLRDPFEPISVFVQSATPLNLYMEGVRNLLAARPATTVSRHTHLRDSVMTLILVQTALRAKNMLLRVGGDNPTLRKELDADGRTIWRIKIGGDEFKNYGSAVFAVNRGFDFILEDEDGLYDKLERYIGKARKYLLAGRESDALFVTSRGNDFNSLAVLSAYHRITAMYFVYNEQTGRGIKGAIFHGPHAVRHVIATHLVKTEGDLYLAAWALQDALSTVEAHYAHFLPSDRFRLAANVLRRARLGLQHERDERTMTSTVVRGLVTNTASFGNASHRRAA